MTQEEVIANVLRHAKACGIPVEQLQHRRVREAYVVDFQGQNSESSAQFVMEKASGEFIGATCAGPEFEPKPTGKQFSKRAQRVLSLASEGSRGLGCDYVGSEHLLLGALADGKGIGADCLASTGLALVAVRDYVATAGFSPEQVQSGYTASMRNALKAAARSAESLRSTEIEPEHLILGLLEESEGGATITFQHFGVREQETRSRLLQRLLTEPR